MRSMSGASHLTVTNRSEPWRRATWRGLWRGQVRKATDVCL